MHDHEKSDRPVVPAKPPNKPAQAGAEVVEGRGLPEGNTASETRPGRSAGLGVSSDLDRVRQVARKGQGSAVHRAPSSRDRRSVAGGVSGDQPERAAGGRRGHVAGLRAGSRGEPSRIFTLGSTEGRIGRGRLAGCSSRSRTGGCGRSGSRALEDKIVQRAVVEVLNAIYEEDFLGFSYGFRPGRAPHDALDALAVGIKRRKVNWVLDADIRDFFTQPRSGRGWRGSSSIGSRTRGSCG